MKNKINQFYTDVFEDKRKTLLLPQTKIFFSVKKDGQYNGNFYIKSGDNRRVRGLIFSSDFRMHLRENGFESTEARISFTYDASGLMPGSLVKGKFVIESEAGEYEIFYTASIEEPYIDTSMGRVCDLAGFTKLCAYNYDEAASLFASTRFRDIMEKESEVISNFYEGMRKLSLNHAALEEFLVGTNQKTQITLKVKTDKRVYHDLDHSETDTLVLSKNTWGYLPISIETVGDFIRVDRDRLTSLDFTGNRFTVEYMIMMERLHEGTNYGLIRVVTPHKTIQIEVEADSKKLSEEEVKKAQSKLRHRIDLASSYAEWRMKRLTPHEWEEKALMILDALISEERVEDPTDSVYQLMKAHVYLEKKDFDAAGEILSIYDKKRWPRNRKLALRGYYIYLSSLQKRELSYSLRAVEELRRLYDHHDDDWSLLWVLLQVEENLIQNGERRLQVISSQWQTGKFSGYLYLEAYLTMLDQPGLIDLSDPFVIHTLLYATHRKILTIEIAQSLAIAVSRQHDFQPFLFEILKACYEINPSKEMLSAICRYLIMGHKMDEDSFTWYALGVKAGLHIAKLYEFFLYSVDMESIEILPEAVFLYFSHQNDLSAERKAYLYANLVRHMEEYPEIYDNSRVFMEAFTRDQFLQKKISGNLRVLYRHFIPMMERDDQFRDALADVLYSYEIDIDNPMIKQVIVLHDNVFRPTLYPLSGGKTIIQLFSDKDRILLRDQSGYVFAGTHPYDLIRLFPEDRYFAILKDEGCSHIGLMLSSCSSGMITEETERFYEQMAVQEEIRDRTKRETKCALLFYFFEKDDPVMIRQYLNEVDDMWLSAEERSLLIGIYLRQNQLKKAYEVVRKYGYEEVDLRYLLELCSRYIKEEYYHENELLLSACYSCFKRNQFDDTMLLYLADFYCGKTSEMKRIWSVAGTRDVKLSKLEERILTQMLFTEEVIGEEDIFYHYYINGGSERITKAYLTLKSFGCFVWNQMLDSRFFEYIETEYARGQEINLSCKLAALRYYADHQPDDPQVRAMAEEFLDDCLSDGYLFAFFKKSGEEVLRKYLLHNRLVVQYQNRSRSKMTIHYRITGKNQKSSSYQSEVMREVYRTYFIKEFVLFAGERLDYYLEEESESGVRICEVGVIEQNDISDEKDGRVYEIDRILSEEYPEGLLDEYDRKNYLIGQLFQVM